jgi:uncharacterized protein YciI
MRSLLLLIILFVFTVSHAQYTFVFLNSRSDKTELTKEALDKLMQGHLANITRLAEEGKLIVAGPLEGGGGIFVLNTSSVDEANEWLSTDPGIQANRWKLDVLPYQPRIGSVCTVKEPYEMVTYTLIRYRSNILKETVNDYPVLWQKHETYVLELAKGGNVITEGIFGNQEGGILIMRGDIHSEVIEHDPGVKGGTLLFETKKLWVARGAFCEE